MSSGCSPEKDQIAQRGEVSRVVLIWLPDVVQRFTHDMHFDVPAQAVDVGAGMSAGSDIACPVTEYTALTV